MQILSHSFKQIFLAVSTGWRRVVAREVVARTLELFENPQDHERAPTPATTLAGMTGRSPVSNLEYLLLDAYDSMNRILHADHSAKVDIIVTSEPVRVFPE